MSFSGFAICTACEAFIAYAKLEVPTTLSCFLVIAYLAIIVGTWFLIRSALLPYFNYRKTCPCCARSIWFPEPILMSTGRCPRCGEKIFSGEPRKSKTSISMLLDERARKTEGMRILWGFVPSVLHFFFLGLWGIQGGDFFKDLMRKSHSLPQFSWQIVPVLGRVGLGVVSSVIFFPLMMTTLIVIPVSKFLPILDPSLFSRCIRCRSPLNGRSKILQLTGNCPGCGSPVVHDPIVPDFQPTPPDATH